MANILTTFLHFCFHHITILKLFFNSPYYAFSFDVTTLLTQQQEGEESSWNDFKRLSPYLVALLYGGDSFL